MKPLPYTPAEVKALIAFHRSVREMLASIAASINPLPAAAPASAEPGQGGADVEQGAAASEQSVRGA